VKTGLQDSIIWIRPTYLTTPCLDLKHIDNELVIPGWRVNLHRIDQATGVNKRQARLLANLARERLMQ
jgi:hypothetical protein